MVYFKIKSTDSYTIKIYRLGYYPVSPSNSTACTDGCGAAFKATISHSGTPRSQDSCKRANGVFDCGNWFVSDSWQIPSDAVSGVYIAKLQLTGGGSSHIVFIVRDDASTSDLLFQTSDATWQAYNTYTDTADTNITSGKCFYPTVDPDNKDRRRSRISYNRPFVTRARSGLSSNNVGTWPSDNTTTGQPTAGSSYWLFDYEYPMIRWLEANGYDVSYAANVDTHRNQYLMTYHKVFMSVGHDEYWTQEMRTHVTDARDAGKHLAFLSGNEVYWKTRFEGSIVTNQDDPRDSQNIPVIDPANRTYVCYKEGSVGEYTCPAGECDPTRYWTGTWRDGCFSSKADGCQPENELSGQLSWGETPGFSLEVPASYRNLRFWRDTPTASGQAFSTSARVIGAEWDPEAVNEFYRSKYPPGRMWLSSTDAVDAPGKVHHLSLYKHSSGAWVFGAGTLQWTWGLDKYHDRSRNTDTTSPDMKQAMVNLFADMNVQPGSLETGLHVATLWNDTANPTVTLSPNGATLPSGTPVTISGTAADDKSIGSVEVSTDGGTTWRGAVLSSVGAGNITWSFPWTPTAQGYTTVKARAFDDSGKSCVQEATTTLAVGPPAYVHSLWQPSDAPSGGILKDNNGLVLGMKFTSSVGGYVTGVRYYKGTADNGNHTGGLYMADGTLLNSAAFAASTGSGWQQVTFSGPVWISANTVYVVAVHSSQGYYYQTLNGFSSPIVNSNLKGLSTAEAVGNGVYALSSALVFPTSTYQASNYWVDVVFDAVQSYTVFKPTEQPKNGDLRTGAGSVEVGMKFRTTVDGKITGVRFFKDAGNLGLHAGFLYDSRTPGSALDWAYFTNETNDGWQELNFSTPKPITAGTTYIVSYQSVHGNDCHYSVSTPNPYTPGFALSTVNGPIRGLATGEYGKNGVYRYGLPGGVSPSTPFTETNGSNYWVDAVFVPTIPRSLFAPTDVPSTLHPAGPALTVGTKFRASVPGQITGVRFYRQASDANAHTVQLYAGTGGPAPRSATFPAGATGSAGWQQVLFGTPYPITPGITYVATDHSSGGFFSQTLNGFGQAIVNGPLRGLADGEDGVNGVYAYAPTPTFPTSPYQASNYWVDPVFLPTSAYRSAPLGTAGVQPSAVAASAVTVYPVPFSNNVTVRFTAAGKGEATLTLYDALGRQVRTLFRGRTDTPHQLEIETDGLPQGLYMFKLVSDKQVITTKAALMR